MHVGMHVTTIENTEFSLYEIPSPKHQLVDIMGYITSFTKNVYTYLLTKEDYITVQFTSRVQRL